MPATGTYCSGLSADSTSRKDSPPSSTAGRLACCCGNGMGAAPAGVITRSLMPSTVATAWSATHPPLRERLTADMNRSSAMPVDPRTCEVQALNRQLTGKMSTKNATYWCIFICLYYLLPKYPRRATIINSGHAAPT
ncbi:protein of unknown function [Rhodovastum atsumiense]|nr:protein of unknown function [Rhodovastum atsumiense]